MASPSSFAEANLVLGPPAGYEGVVVPLYVRRLDDGQLISCWELDEHELAEVNRTGKIWLSVWSGLSQPPVAIAATQEALADG